LVITSTTFIELCRFAVSAIASFLSFACSSSFPRPVFRESTAYAKPRLEIFIQFLWFGPNVQVTFRTNGKNESTFLKDAKTAARTQRKQRSFVSFGQGMFLAAHYFLIAVKKK
jgi:hypothetical protein